jgi:N-methylhydantoinase B
VREIEILASDASVTLIGERRTLRPWGSSGGEDGAAGLDEIDGEAVPAKVTRAVSGGAVLRVETPGGGGWGRRPRDG